MVLVFTLLSKHGDQNPEARAVSAGASLFFFLPWHWPTSLLAAVLRILLKGSSWGFWWLTGNWYADNPIHFSTLKCYFSFYELVPQLYNYVLKIQWDLLQKSREDLKKYLYYKKKKGRGCVKIQMLPRLYNYPKHLCGSYLIWLRGQVHRYSSGERRDLCRTLSVAK